MRRGFFIRVAALVVAAMPFAGNTQTVPKRIGGHPNLNGLWQSMSTAYWNLEGHAAAPLDEFWRLGAIGAIPAGQSVVDGGDIPYTPAALAKRNENARNRLTLDPEVKCYMPGIPRANYMPYPFQIVQSTDYILIAYEFASASRTVRMNYKEESPTDSWMGWSRGRWEGEALVIDVTGFNDSTWFDRAGNYHSDKLHVVERWTATSPNSLNYEATIEDPNVFSRPWKVSFPLYRRLEKNAQLLEYKCVEFVEELMYGHRRKQPSR